MTMSLSCSLGCMLALSVTTAPLRRQLWHYVNEPYLYLRRNLLFIFWGPWKSSNLSEKVLENSCFSSVLLTRTFPQGHGTQGQGQGLTRYPRPRTLVQGQGQWLSFNAKDTEKITIFRDNRTARVKLTVTSLTISLSIPDYWSASVHDELIIIRRVDGGGDDVGSDDDVVLLVVSTRKYISAISLLQWTGLGLGLEVYEAKSFIPRPEDCVLEAKDLSSRAHHCSSLCWTLLNSLII